MTITIRVNGQKGAPISLAWASMNKIIMILTMLERVAVILLMHDYILLKPHLFFDKMDFKAT